MTPWYAGEFTVVSSDTNFSMEYPHKIWPEKWYVYVPPSVGSWRSPIELSPTFSDSADSHQVAAIDCHPFERLGGMACSSWVPGFCGRIVKSKEEGKFEATFKTTWKKRDFGVKTMEVAKRKVAKYRYFIELLSVVFSCYQFFTRHSVVSLSFPQFFSGCWSVLRDLGARWPESSPIWGTTKRRLPSCPWSDGRRRKSTRDGRDGLITGVKLWSKIHPNFNQFFFLGLLNHIKSMAWLITGRYDWTVEIHESTMNFIWVNFITTEPCDGALEIMLGRTFQLFQLSELFINLPWISMEKPSINGVKHPFWTALLVSFKLWVPSIFGNAFYA